MNQVRELKIDRTLCAAPTNIINLLDFKPEKLRVETKCNTNNDIKVHQVRYENGGFYLTIDNIRGYFNFSNNMGILNMIFANDDQQNKYHQIWKEILKVINRENGKLELHEKIKIIDSDLPIEHVFKIPSITIAIKSLIEGWYHLIFAFFLSCAFVFCCLTFSVPLFRWLEHDDCCVCFFVFSLFSLSLLPLTRSH